MCPGSHSMFLMRMAKTIYRGRVHRPASLHGAAAPAAPDPSDPDVEAWRAVMARDSAYDGKFVYAVTSTGVFCRPSCGSRRPRRENVRFYASPEAASVAGFRACRRCRPDDVPRAAAAVLQARDLLDR